MYQQINIFILLFISNLAFAAPIPGDRLPLPLPRCRVLSKIFFVNAKYVGSSDGNPQTPFVNFNQALSAATNSQVCNLEIKVADGTYSGILNIDRNTIISALGAQAVLVGSILNSSGASLKLNGIQINSAAGVGINQSGGLLEMNNSSILWTKSQKPASELSGTGLVLSHSARAILTSVQISTNQNRGIYITDQGSVLWANHLTMLRNNNQGIEITNSAKAFLNDIIVEENIKVGIFISNSSKVNLQYSRIRFSKFVTPGNWGSNIVVTNNSILDITNFNSSGADAAGIAFDNAFVTASLGQIDNNASGLAYFNTTYNIVNCIGSNVTFTGNQSTTGGGIPLPSTCPTVDDNCMKQYNCARVPWEMP